jgi:hypothetical protein
VLFNMLLKQWIIFYKIYNQNIVIKKVLIIICYIIYIMSSQICTGVTVMETRDSTTKLYSFKKTLNPLLYIILKLNNIIIIKYYFFYKIKLKTQHFIGIEPIITMPKIIALPLS